MLLDTNIVIQACQPGGGWLDPWTTHPDAAIASVTRIEALGFAGISPEEETSILDFVNAHLTDMKKCRRRCTPEYDLRLSRYFGTSPGFWLRLQLDYELMRGERENGERISREVHPHAA